MRYYIRTFPEPSTTHGGVVYTWQPSSSSSSSSQTTLSASTSSLLESAPTPSSDTITTITTTTATATLATTTNTSGPSYVALIGDALHFFPPDVGQVGWSRRGREMKKLRRANPLFLPGFFSVSLCIGVCVLFFG